MFLSLENFFKFYMDPYKIPVDMLKARLAKLREFNVVQQREVNWLRSSLAKRPEIKWLGFNDSIPVTETRMQNLRRAYRDALKLVQASIEHQMLDLQSEKGQKSAQLVRQIILGAILGSTLTVYFEDHLDTRGIKLISIFPSEKDQTNMIDHGRILQNALTDRLNFGGEAFGSEILRAHQLMNEMTYVGPKLSNSEYKDKLVEQNIKTRVADSISYLADKENGYLAEKAAVAQFAKGVRAVLSGVSVAEGPGLFVLGGDVLAASQPLSFVKQILLEQQQ
jgi:hypothetical protein